MTIDLCGGTYFRSTCGLEGKGMPIFRKKEANFSTDPVRFLQRLLDCCQNPIQLSKSNHPGEKEAFDKTKPLN